MVEFGDGSVEIIFGEYGNKSHMEIAEEIQAHLGHWGEEGGKDFFLYLRRGDDVASGMELYNLRLLEDPKLRALLNRFV